MRLSRLTASERGEWLALAEMRALHEPAQAERLAELAARLRERLPEQARDAE